MSKTPPTPGQQFDGVGATFRVGKELGAWAELDEVVWTSLEQLSRALRVPEAGLHDTLVAVLVAAVELVDGAEAAGLNLFEKGQFTPQAVLGLAPPQLDALQQETGSGPCIDASREQRTVEVTDTRIDERWPRFGRRAVQLNVLSMLCVPLWIDERRLGSLSLYAPAPDAFGPTAKKLAALYASHAALALADAQRIDQMRRAMANRDVIGQAKGILMATRGVTADDAFELLVATSQRVNRKLVDVAEDLAATGQLPAV